MRIPSRRAIAAQLGLAALLAGLLVWRPWAPTCPPSQEGGGRSGSDELPAAEDSHPPVLRGSAPPTAPAPASYPAAPSPDVAGGRGALLVFVTDSGGTPVRDARVRIANDRPPQRQTTEALTGSDGSARFEDLPIGGYRVRAQRQGYSEATRPAHISVDGMARVNFALEPTVVIRGQVLRGRTDDPIAGAHVAARPGGSAGGRTIISVGAKPLAEVISDRDGRFMVEVPANGILTLGAIAQGMAEAHAYLLPTRDVEDLVLRLDAGGTITGRVLAPDGKPSVGARVFGVPADQPQMIANPRLVLGPNGGSFCSNTDDGGGMAEFEGEGPIHGATRAIADAEGQYELTNISLPARVRVLAEGVDGSRGGTHAVALTEASPLAVKGVTLEPRAVVAVRVLDPVDQFVASAAVTIKGVSADAEGIHFLDPRGEGSWRDYTGAHGGAFRFPGLAIGRYAVVAKGPAGDEVRATVEVTAGGEQGVTVHVQQASAIAGVVVDEVGRPIEKASVAWRGVSHETDAEGRFEIRGAASEEPVLEASSKWHLTARLEEPDEARPVRVVLRARPVVTGVLLPAEGGESLRDHVWVAEHTESCTTYETAAVDPKGRFRYPLRTAQEEVVLLLLPRGAADVLLGPFHLPAGAERDAGELQLDLGRSIRGTVVDEQDRPVAGSAVRAGRPGLLDVRDGMFVSAPEAATAADGTFHIAQVHRGRLSVRVRHRDHAPTVLDDPPEQGLRIVLAPASFLEGTVRDPDGKPQPGLTIVAAHEVSLRLMPGISTQTDDRGHFRLGPLAAGEYPLTAYRGRQRVDLGSVVLRKGQTVVHDVTLR